MKIWLPLVVGGSGVDVFTRLLARSLNDVGHEAVVQPLPHAWQYFPAALSAVRQPDGVSAVITNSWNGFAFRRRGLPLVVVEHLCVFQREFLPYRSMAQGIFHQVMVKRFEKKSFAAANAIVSVSSYTSRSLKESLGVDTTHVIPNAVDIDLFTPRADGSDRGPERPFRVLFVGNLSVRKGADLLPAIMQHLGSGFELRYTTGLRVRRTLDGIPDATPLGKLTHPELVEEYRAADVVLFPTRLEGFGYSAAEAMACGIPVVATRCSSLPEVIDDGVTGLLCTTDAVAEFADAIRLLQRDPERRRAMGGAGRKAAERRFTLERMARDYSHLLDGLMQ